MEKLIDRHVPAAAFMLGTSAVQLGTAFLRCEEAEVREAHRAALAAADDASTVVTDVISGRPCRYIRNGMIDELIASGIRPWPVPAQQSLTSPLTAAGDREWTALTAGQSAALPRDTGAAKLVERIADETTRRLRAFA
jgi:nitronate monooxygenase